MSVYTYTALRDVKPDGKAYNIWGCVKFFREPRRTRGPDWSMSLIVTDESLGHDGKVTFNLFLNDRSKFPAISRPGAIVRFHRVKFNLHNDQLQGQNSPGFSNLVFEHDSLQPKTPQTQYTFTERDTHRLKELKKWSESFITKELRHSCKKIKDIMPNMFFDLYCQVVGEVKLNDHHVVLKVWDGTKQNDKVDIMKIVEDTDSHIQYDQVVYPHVKDYLVDVSVFEDHVQEADSILLGDYVGFYNLRAFVPNKLKTNTDPACKVELCLHSGASYGRSLKTLDEDTASKLRSELNQLIESDDNSSRENIPRDNVDIADISVNVMKELSRLETSENLLYACKSILDEAEPVLIDKLFPKVLDRDLNLSTFKFIAKTITIGASSAHESLVLFCWHCHYLSSIPSADVKLKKTVPSGHKEKIRQSLRLKKDMKTKVKDRINTPKNGRIQKPLTKYCVVPVSGACQASYKLKNLKLRSSEWCVTRTPYVQIPDVMTYYTCPGCSQDEKNRCVLSYSFLLDVHLADDSGEIRAVLFDDALVLDGGETIYGRDVFVKADVCDKYERWLRTLAADVGKASTSAGGGDRPYEATIRIHRKTSTSTRSSKNDDVYQLLKLTPVQNATT